MDQKNSQSTSENESMDENFVIASSKPKEKKSLFSKKKANSKADAANTETAAADNDDANSAADEPAKKPNKFRRLVDRFGKQKVIATIVVIVVVIGAAGAGFWVWHETPSFCGAICHSPMDPYMPTYYQEPNTTGVDKWGNEVEDTSGMLAPVHRAYADMGCMGCHEPAIVEQVTEGIEWATGNYYYPLNERNLSRLVFYRGVGETEFCLNSACHNMSKTDLTNATEDAVRNPHSWHHTEYTCSDCHKAHRASVMICSQCHEDYTLPDGWITVSEERELETTYGQYATLEAGE